MKTPLLKSNLLIKPSSVLAAAVLTAATLLVPFARAAEPPILMPTGRGGGQPDNGIQPFDPNPAGRGSITRKFMTYGEDSDGNTVPTKTLRITNNTADTVYPIMRAENSNQLASNPAVGLYDPYDPPDKEYRGYIGYKQGDKYYHGLKKGESIVVSLPLVLWNAARIGIGTDGKYLTVKPGELPNPLRYNSNAQRSITKANPDNDTGVVPYGESNDTLLLCELVKFPPSASQWVVASVCGAAAVVPLATAVVTATPVA